MHSFPNFEPVCSSKSSSNCCFLTCIQISQEAEKVVWYFHLLRIFQFVVIHTVKGFSVVNEADVFWNSVAFSRIQWMLAIRSLVPLPFLSPACTSGSFQFRSCWSLAWRILSITLKVNVKVAQSCLTLCDPMDYTVHGILQARILEWVTFPFSRGSSQPRNQTQVFHIAGGFFTSWATREASM